MGVAIVILNHLRTVSTLLHELLPRHTAMPVELITEGLVLQPNHVFIIPAKRDLHVLDGEFQLKPISQGMTKDPAELQALADDLLINVTRFFRDAKTFDLLAEKIVPEFVRLQPPVRPIRVWVTGCSTGEEAYSIGMLFLEGIKAVQRNIKLQIFASDIDADAVAVARGSVYPDSVEVDVPPERLTRFFTKENHGYRVSRELRAASVFSVSDQFPKKRTDRCPPICDVPMGDNRRPLRVTRRRVLDRNL